MSQPVIDIKALTRRFGPVIALDHIDLAIERGEVFGLVGPNGAGKTTLIRILCGIHRPSSGQAIMLGLDASRNREQIRRRLGYMSQTFSLYAELTVAENLRFYARVYGGVSSARVDSVTARLGLAAGDLRTRVDHLATGKRQRAALAAAVLHSPQLVFLDEPTSGVDPAGRRDFWALIRQLTEDGTTVVVSTHVIAEADRCDRLALLADGRCIAVGTPHELCDRTGLRILRIQTDDWQTTYEEIKARWPEATLHGTAIHLPRPVTDDPTAELGRVLSHVPVMNLETVSPTIEDAFVWYVRAGHPVPRP